jgi:hypothetical protein
MVRNVLDERYALPVHHDLVLLTGAGAPRTAPEVCLRRFGPARRHLRSCQARRRE